MIYQKCPVCNCNVPIHDGDDGTQSFISTDISTLIFKIETLEKQKEALETKAVSK